MSHFPEPQSFYITTCNWKHSCNDRCYVSYHPRTAAQHPCHVRCRWNMMCLSLIENDMAENFSTHYFSWWSSMFVSIFVELVYNVVDRGTNLAAQYMAVQLRYLQLQLCPVPTEAPWSLGHNERSHKFIHCSIDKIISHTPSISTTRLMGKSKWHGTLPNKQTVKYLTSTALEHSQSFLENSPKQQCINELSYMNYYLSRKYQIRAKHSHRSLQPLPPRWQNASHVQHQPICMVPPSHLRLSKRSCSIHQYSNDSCSPWYSYVSNTWNTCLTIRRRTSNISWDTITAQWRNNLAWL